MGRSVMQLSARQFQSGLTILQEQKLDTPQGGLEETVRKDAHSIPECRSNIYLL